MQAALKLLWYRQARTCTPTWEVPCFNGPLLPYETTPYYVTNQQQQADSELQHELADITIRELARYITTALTLCEQHDQQVLPNVLTGKVVPSIIYTRPLTQEAQQLIALSPGLRQQVFSRLLPRFAVNR